jgi:hypothetical protein
MPIIGSVLKRAVVLNKKIRFKRAEPIRYQEKVIRRLLRNAKDTYFGLTYGFSEILKSEHLVRDFQLRVPTHDYNTIFNRWWERSKRGEKDVAWPGKVKYFALSSGTSEASSKYIPVTKDMLKAITKASFKQYYSMANYNLPPEVFQKGILILGSSTTLHDKGTHYEGDMSGISANQAIPFWMSRVFKPGKDILSTTDWNAKLDKIARQAREWDIAIMCGIPAWVQIMIERVLAYNKVQTLHDIWPNLKLYVHGGIAFDPYRKTFDRFFSKPIIYVETYMASEGFFAFRARPEAEGMRLILNNGIFYEFAEFSSRNFDNGMLKPEARIITIDKVEEGKDYAILLSTCAGAWRYMIGDTVRFTNAHEAEVIITGRTKHFLSICGEHLSVDNMTRALHLAAREIDADLQEFTVQGIAHQNLFAHKWYVGAKGPVKATLLREVLDRKLIELNDDYAVERANVLKDIFVEVVPNDLFLKWLRLHGKEGNQGKFPRVMKSDQFSEWEQFVERELTTQN